MKARSSILTLVFILLCHSIAVAAPLPPHRELFDAIKVDNAEKVAEILKKNPKLTNKKIPYNRYPVLEAAAFGSAKSLKVLMENGANITKKDKTTGNSILHTAVESAKVKASKRNAVFDLIMNTKKVNIEVRNKNKKTPFHYAFSSHINTHGTKVATEIIELFEKHKADLNTQDSSGETVLHFLAKQFAPKTQQRTEETLDVLIKKGVDLNIKDKNKCTPLLFFLIDNKKLPEDMKIEFVSLLVKNGAKTKIKSKDGQRPLKIVTKKGKLYKIIKKGKK